MANTEKNLQLIKNSLYSKLVADSALEELVGERIYGLNPKVEANKLPRVIYEIVSDRPIPSDDPTMRVSLADINFLIEDEGDTTTTSDNIEAAIFSCIAGHGTLTNNDIISYKCTKRGIVSQRYVEDLDRIATQVAYDIMWAPIYVGHSYTITALARLN